MGTLVIVVLVVFPILFLIAFVLSDHGTAIRAVIQFFIAGYDCGFKTRQSYLLWQLAQKANIDEPSALFWSLPTLNRAIAHVLKAAKDEGKENEASMQQFFTKLYAYRTRVEFNQSKYKTGIETTHSIREGQKFRIFVKNEGVFYAKVILNGSRGITTTYPVMNGTIINAIQWINTPITVFFWRHDDAGYSFTTKAVSSGMFKNARTLILAHSNNLGRSQKRKSVRIKCSIFAQMYLIRALEKATDMIESESGMKCLLEDLSEDGALILIGGKGAAGLQIKIQFILNNVFIVMIGLVRGVTYNEETNQSRLHFECSQLNSRMKNAILSFVYNVLPADEKAEYEAIRLSEEDAAAAAEPETAQDNEELGAS